MNQKEISITELKILKDTIIERVNHHNHRIDYYRRELDEAAYSPDYCREEMEKSQKILDVFNEKREIVESMLDEKVMELI